jgi:hypothetical protein
MDAEKYMREMGHTLDDKITIGVSKEVKGIIREIAQSHGIEEGVVCHAMFIFALRNMEIIRVTADKRFEDRWVSPN